MRIVLALALLVGCGRDAAPPTATSDTLWSLTPSGARGAIVISARGVAMIENGYTAARALIERVPDLAAARSRLAEALAPFDTNLTLADFGFTPSKGAALFMMKSGMVAVLPLADRDKFLAKTHGTKGELDTIDTTTCKPIGAHYVCATSPQLFDTLGKGDLKRHLATRGDIEIVGAELPFGGKPMTVAAAVQLARGAATVRATVANLPAELANRLAQTATPAVDAQRTAGFALVDLRAWLPPSEEQLVGGYTVAQALASMDGLLSVATPAGATVLNVAQAVNAVEPFKTIVERCSELPGADAIHATSQGGVCTFKAPSWDVELDLWMDGKTVRVGKQASPPAGAQVPMTQVGRELARGAWSFVFWGRGTMLAGPPIPGVEPVEVPAEAAMVIRLMALVNELGFGARVQGHKVELIATVRTMFANPDDVLAKVQAITANDIAATRARALAEPIARSSPSSPFAHDFAAGHAGLLVPTALAGQAVSLAVSALMLVRAQDVPPTDLQ